MSRGENRGAAAERVVDPALTAKALAKAVYDGDIVNLRHLFSPFSPARKGSPERFETEKYAYLLPCEATEAETGFAEALAAVQRPETWGHIERELEADRPAQMTSELVVLLGDRAVRAGKYTSAAQAYELLRIRRRMQEEFFRQGDRALDNGEIRKGVGGYLIGTGLSYDYAAFPEPQPAVPNFQTRALMLHGEYPERPEDCLALQEPGPFLRTALSYLLAPDVAARLEGRPQDQLVAFLKELVHQRDPEWETFVHRYGEACATVRRFGKRLERGLAQASESGSRLAAEIEEELGEDPGKIPAQVLGRVIENGEWWQYLKELAYKHPAAVLFVSRQAIGDLEILVPLYPADSPIVQTLGLVKATAAPV